MDVERFCLKFLAHPTNLDEATLIPIFHEWIRRKTLPGTLIDVADYRHVPQGPGIMLISHEINYAMEHGGGQFGLSAQRKLGGGASNQERILELARRLALFGSLLEEDQRLSGQLRFDGGSFIYQANDRLRAPNTAEAFAAIQSDLQTAGEALYGGQPVTVTRVENDPRDRLTAMVQTNGSMAMTSLQGQP